MTATDLVLTVTQLLRKHGVVDKFVEFYGPALAGLSLADRATIANMSPEYGATMGFFPVDDQTLAYLRLSGRSPELVAIVEAYCKEQGLFRTAATPDPAFSEQVSLDLSTVEASLAGPKRPQDRVPLSKMKEGFREALSSASQARRQDHGAVRDGSRVVRDGPLQGAVVIAAITSCTNTSNPSVMLGAGIARQEGGRARPDGASRG